MNYLLVSSTILPFTSNIRFNIFQTYEFTKTNIFPNFLYTILYFHRFHELTPNQFLKQTNPSPTNHISRSIVWISRVLHGLLNREAGSLRDLVPCAKRVHPINALARTRSFARNQTNRGCGGRGCCESKYAI